MDQFPMSPIGLSLSQTNLSTNQLAHQPGTTAADVIPMHHDDFEHQVTALQKEHQRRYMPRLMLLTVASTPKLPCELQVGIKDDFSPVPGWLQAGEDSLDGVYIQFEPEMMTPKGAATVAKLSRNYAVGIWGYSGKDPDNWDTFHWLVERCQVNYVNTDLPTNFRKDVTLPTRKKDYLTGTSL